MTTTAKVNIIQSPAKPQAAARSKSAEATGRKSVTSLGSVGSIGAEQPRVVCRSPSPTSKSMASQAPLPEIQITRTESNRSTVDEKWVKPEKMEEDKGKLSALIICFNQIEQVMFEYFRLLAFTY